jgi:hypothetical protein
MTTEVLQDTANSGLDYGQPLEFAYFLNPDAGDPQGVLETARLADGLGYDLLGIQDHPYQPRHLDAMSLAAAILAQTSSVRVFTPSPTCRSGRRQCSPNPRRHSTC